MTRNKQKIFKLTSNKSLKNKTVTWLFLPFAKLAKVKITDQQWQYLSQWAPLHITGKVNLQHPEGHFFFFCHTHEKQTFEIVTSSDQ